MINSKEEIATLEITYEEALERVKDKIEHSLSNSPLLIRKYTKHLLGGQGKFIRAVSVITCAENKDGMVPTNAVTVAAAIEMLHLATLVHDDVIDNADLRRGIETLQKKYGPRTAVICGDYLLSVSLVMLSAIPNKKDYLELSMPNYIGKLCLGELDQHMNYGNIELSIYQYLKIISGKTAALFEASFYGGAILSGCSDSDSSKLKQLGHYIGMIFQLSDDCIDFDTAKEIANKPVQSDYEQGVITLPLIHALNKEKDLKEKAKTQRLTRQEINQGVKRSGGLMFTQALIEKYHNKAMKIIHGLDITDSKKEKLTGLLKKASRLT